MRSLTPLPFKLTILTLLGCLLAACQPSPPTVRPQATQPIAASQPAYPVASQAAPGPGSPTQQAGRSYPAPGLPTPTPLVGQPLNPIVPAGTTDWPVILPPAFTPEPEANASSALLPTPIPIQLPGDRLQAMIQALQPLPTFQPTGKGQAAPQEVKVLPQQAVDFDFTGDGKSETIFVYLIHPIYGDPYLDDAPNGKLGLALFDDQNQRLWSTIIDLPEGISGLYVDAQPISLAPGENGLLFRQLVFLQGTGSYEDGLATVYRWDGKSLVSVWQRNTNSGGNNGYALGERIHESVRMQDINHDGRVEILVARTRYYRDVTQMPDVAHFELTLPGEMAYEWNGQTYVPALYVHGSDASPIRPWPLLDFAPRLSAPLKIDGDIRDWNQVEYFAGHSTEWNGNQGQLTLGGRVAWDASSLYLTGDAAPGQTLTIGIDSDLAGDFSQTRLDSDDFVLKATLPGDVQCTSPVDLRLEYPQVNSAKIQVAAALSDTAGFCHLEVALPLSMFHLDSTSLVPTPGWAEGSTDPEKMRSYHPQAGSLIGLAIASEDRASTPTFRSDDPTTWSTVVFTADR